LGVGVEGTLTTAFTLYPKAQFDQAGIMVLVNENCWVKAGIEFTDGVPRLSCVVTNDGFSDWSTQEWKMDSQPEGGVGESVSLRVRVSKMAPGGVDSAQGAALVMEAAPYKAGDAVDSPVEWFQVRIASLRGGDKPWRMGLFAICPIEQKKCKVKFHHIRLGEVVKPVHETDAGAPDAGD
jgi:regulation of enolase protein 1 (concanavalin A-like superfamily)